MEAAPLRPTLGFVVRVFVVALLISTVVGLLLTFVIGERAAGAVRMAIMFSIFFLASPDWRQRPLQPYLIHGAFILALSFLVEYWFMPLIR